MHVKMPSLVVFIYSDAVAQTEHKKDLFFSQKRKARYLMEHTFKTYLFIYNEAN